MSDSWAMLGIERTTDQRAIKRAYAARLKAIDPDRDPAAFLALREALEQAQWDARYNQDGEDQDQDQDQEAFASGDESASSIAHAQPAAAEIDRGPRWEEAGVEPEPPTQPEPEELAPEPATEEPDPYRPLADLLWREEPLDADEKAAMVKAGEALLADPAFEQIDKAGELEDWMAWALASNMPRSDPLVPMAVDHFGWAPLAGTVNERYGIGALVQRYNDLRCAARLSGPFHKWNRVHTLLGQPRPPGMVTVGEPRQLDEVTAYLDSIRFHNPTVEWGLDQDHVAHWDALIERKWQEHAASAPAAKQGDGFNFWWLLLIFPLLNMCAKLMSDDRPALPSSVSPPVVEGPVAEGPVAGGYPPAGPSPLQVPEPYPFPAEAPPAPRAPALLFEDLQAWRAEQAPRVQQWMDEHQVELYRLTDQQRRIGPGYPSCTALNAAMRMTTPEYDRCYDAQVKREEKAATDAQALISKVPETEN